jgi:hypothetical protein
MLLNDRIECICEGMGGKAREVIIRWESESQRPWIPWAM